MMMKRSGAQVRRTTKARGLTKTTDARKPPGRPRKAPDQKLEQFSIRLPPKLKFGLSLLAKHQGRSLSMAVEWALQVGLRNAILTGGSQSPWKEVFATEPESIGDLVDAIWAVQSERQRLVYLWQREPNLVDFGERGICELISYSIEMTPNLKNIWESNDRQPLEAMDTERWLAFSRDYHACVWKFLEKHWDILLSKAEDMMLEGKSLRGRSISQIALQHSIQLEEEFSNTVRPALEKWVPSVLR